MMLRRTQERVSWQCFVLLVLSQGSICLRTGLHGMVGQCIVMLHGNYFCMANYKIVILSRCTMWWMLTSLLST